MACQPGAKGLILGPLSLTNKLLRSGTSIPACWLVYRQRCVDEEERVTVSVAEDLSEPPFDRIPSNCVINVFAPLVVGGSSSPPGGGSVRLCARGVTDVRRNVWVSRSPGGASSRCTAPPPHPPPPPRPRLQLEAAGWEATWCEAGSFLTSSITRPWEIPAGLPVTGDSMGWDRRLH